MKTEQNSRPADAAALLQGSYTNLQFNSLPGWARDLILVQEAALAAASSLAASHARLVEALEQTLFALELIIAPYAEIPDAHISDSTRVARIVAVKARSALSEGRKVQS